MRAATAVSRGLDPRLADTEELERVDVASLERGDVPVQDGCAIVSVAGIVVVVGIVVGTGCEAGFGRAERVCESHEPQTDDAALDGRVCDLQLDPVVVPRASIVVVIASVVTGVVSGAQGPRDRTDGHGELAQGEFKRYNHVDVDARHGDRSAGECDLCKPPVFLIGELAKLESELELEVTYLHRAYADAVGTCIRFLRIFVRTKNTSSNWVWVWVWGDRPLDVRHPAVRERDGLDAVFEERQLRCAK